MLLLWEILGRSPALLQKVSINLLTIDKLHTPWKAQTPRTSPISLAGAGIQPFDPETGCLVRNFVHCCEIFQIFGAGGV